MDQHERDQHFERIYKLFERQRAEFNSHVSMAVRFLAGAGTIVVVGLGVVMYFFLSDQANTVISTTETRLGSLDNRVESKLTSLEMRVSQYLSDQQTRLEEVLESDRLSNRVRSELISKALEEAKNAVDEALASPEVIQKKTEFSNKIIDSISKDLEQEVRKIVASQISTNVRKRLETLDPETRNVVEELVSMMSFIIPAGMKSEAPKYVRSSK